MKDVSDILHRFGEEFSIENRTLKKMTGQAGETIPVSGGEIIDHIDGSTGLEEANKVTSNEACSPRDEKFHRRGSVPKSGSVAKGEKIGLSPLQRPAKVHVCPFTYSSFFSFWALDWVLVV